MIRINLLFGQGKKCYYKLQHHKAFVPLSRKFARERVGYL